MADAKLTELTAATAAAASDTLYLVQNDTSKKITVSNFLGAVSTPTVFNSKLQIQGSETISGGAVSAFTNITILSDPTSNSNMSITTGSDGQIKIIVMASNSGNKTLNLIGSNVKGTFSFSAVGHAATLMYTNNYWYMIGGSAIFS